MKLNKKVRGVILGILLTVMIGVSTTYAFWRFGIKKEEEDYVKTACLDIKFEGKNDIYLQDAVPMYDYELEDFLQNTTPFHFEITNKCDNLVTSVINLESIEVGDLHLNDKYIDALLFEDDYNKYLNSSKKLISNPLNDQNKVIEEALHAYKLHTVTLRSHESKEYNLILYMDKDTPMSEAKAGNSWGGKITLSTEYQQDFGTLKLVKSSTSDGLWSKKSDIKKIVFEPEIKEKVAGENEIVHGPYDESVFQTNKVQSYVVCDQNDENCTAYIEGNGKVKANPDSSYLFYGFYNVDSIEGLEYLDTSEVTKMIGTFSGLNQPNIDFSLINTSNVTDMSGMFSGSNFENLDVTSFDTGKVTSMAGMFSSMSNLKSIDLHTFDTKNLNSISGMFNGDRTLTSLDLSTFNTERLYSVGGLVNGCTSLTEINLSNWIFNDNIANSLTGSSSIYTCTSLENLILDNVNTSRVTNMNQMFVTLNQTPKLTTIDLSDFDTRNVTNIANMFGGSSSLKSLDLSMFDTSHVINANYVFSGATGLTELNISNWDLSKVETQGAYSLNIFSGNSLLSTINMTNFVFPSNSSNLFSAGLNGLNDIILTGSDTSHVTNMQSMFGGNSSLKTLDFSSWNTSNVTNMISMFGGTYFESLDLSNFDVSHVTSIDNIFGGAYKLHDLNLSNWDLSNYGSSSISMFGGNSLLETIDMTNFVFPNICYNLFSAGLTGLKEVILADSDTSNVTNMQNMFSGCSSLTTVDFSSWNTSNVTNMSSMFSGASSLPKLDLSNFDVTHVISIGSIFSGAFKLEELNLSNWDLSNYGSSSISMFGGNSLLETIDMTNFVFPTNCSGFFASGLTSLKNLIFDGVNTENITNMSGMFSGCTAIVNLDLSNFDTTNVTSIGSMFYNMNNLEELNLSNWKFNNNITNNFVNMSSLNSNQNTKLAKIILNDVDTSNVTNMSGMFENLTNSPNLITLDLSDFDTSNVTNISYMFNNSKYLKTLDLSTWDTSSVLSASSVFYSASGLTNLNLSNWNLSKVNSSSYSLYFFNGNSLLETIDMTNFVFPSNCSGFFASGLTGLNNLILTGSDTSNVTNMSNMFSGLSKITELDLTSWDTSHVTIMSGIFSGSSKITELNLSSWDTSHVTSISGIFSGATGLTDLNLSGWNLSNLTANPGMFGGNSLLETIDMTNFVFPSNCSGFFASGLTGLNNLILTGSDTSHVTNMSNMFSGLSKITELDLSMWDTTNLTSIGYMFQGMRNLQELNLSNWKFNNSLTSGFVPMTYLNGDSNLKNIILENVNTSNVTTMNSMFSGINSVPNLTTLDLSDFDTRNVTNIASMFSSSSSIKTLDLSNFDVSHVTSIGSIFTGATGLTDLNLSGWNLSHLTSNISIFGGNTLLKTIDMTNFVFPTNCSGFFATGLTGLNNLILTGSDTSHVTNMNTMFAGNSSFTNLDLSMWDTSHVTDVSSMFGGVSNLQTLNLSNWDLSSLDSRYSPSLLVGNSKLETIDMTNFVFPINSNSFFSAGLTSLNKLIFNNINTSNVTNMSGMFAGLSSIKELDLGNFDTSHVTNMSRMFAGTSSLTSLNLSNFDTRNVTNISGMFSDMKNLATLNLSNFKVNNVTSIADLFSKMDSLRELNLSSWVFNNYIAPNFAKISGLNKIYELDDNPHYQIPLETLILTNSNTSNVTNMAYMFENLNKVTELDLSGFDTSHVTYMQGMFIDCLGLTSLNLSSFNTQNVNDMRIMFADDINLNEITYSSNFIHKENANIQAMFGGSIPAIDDPETIVEYNLCPANKPDENVHESWHCVFDKTGCDTPVIPEPDTPDDGNIELDKDVPLVSNGDDGLYAVSHDNLQELGSEWNKPEYRYAGSNPNNYVSFNNEIWRIIGLVNVKVGSSVEQRLKIVRTEGIPGQKYVGCYGYDKWTSNGNIINNWNNAQLKNMLNGIYYQSGSGSCYRDEGCGGQVSSSSCDFSGEGTLAKGLDDTAREMIDNNVIWSLGSASTASLTANEFYEVERGNVVYGSNPSEWSTANDSTSKGVGLVYPSDIGYAFGGTSRESCLNKKMSTRCNSNSSWIDKGYIIQTLTPSTSYKWDVIVFEGTSQVGNTYIGARILPTVYLKTNVKIVDGEGSINDTYKLSLEN